MYILKSYSNYIKVIYLLIKYCFSFKAWKDLYIEKISADQFVESMTLIIGKLKSEFIHKECEVSVPEHEEVCLTESPVDIGYGILNFYRIVFEYKIKCEISIFFL